LISRFDLRETLQISNQSKQIFGSWNTKQDLAADTVIENWFLIDLKHDGTLTNKRLLWGTVVQDLKRRWVPGNYCCTSLVLGELGDQLVQSKTVFTVATAQ